MAFHGAAATPLASNLPWTLYARSLSYFSYSEVCASVFLCSCFFSMSLKTCHPNTFWCLFWLLLTLPCLVGKAYFKEKLFLNNQLFFNRRHRHMIYRCKVKREVVYLLNEKFNMTSIRNYNVDVMYGFQLESCVSNNFTEKKKSKTIYKCFSKMQQFSSFSSEWCWK